MFRRFQFRPAPVPSQFWSPTRASLVAGPRRPIGRPIGRPNGASYEAVPVPIQEIGNRFRFVWFGFYGEFRQIGSKTVRLPVADSVLALRVFRHRVSWLVSTATGTDFSGGANLVNVSVIFVIIGSVSPSKFTIESCSRFWGRMLKIAQTARKLVQGPQTITIEHCSRFWSVLENVRSNIVHASGKSFCFVRACMRGVDC